MTPYIVVSDGIPAVREILLHVVIWREPCRLWRGWKRCVHSRRAVIVSVIFAALARLVRGVTVAGAIAGAVICCLLYVGAGLGAFLVLVSVFALTWLGTRFGYRRKEKLGTAERLDGRTALQVLANLAVAAGCAGLSAVTAQESGVLARGFGGAVGGCSGYCFKRSGTGTKRGRSTDQ